jgi:photosystem II stability/assembly factor-like uncharacterized protein
MKAKILLLAGTRKGLFSLSSADRKRWKLEGPFQSGKEINHAIRDPRTGRLFATANDAWFGSEIVWSDDLGKNWQSAKEGPAFSADSGLKLERIWHIEAAQDGSLYAGVAPAALYRSNDGGESWQEVTGLTEHESRPQWHPGAGGLCLHSIALDPNNPPRIFVGISAAGVFRTDDGGASWRPRNQGTRAEFLPEKYPELGQCVHKLLIAPGASSRLFQQNHCGVYRSDDAGDTWQEITTGLPSDFGFPLALHPRDPETLYVIPLKGAEFRCPPEGKLRVFRSRDGGETWDALSDGLPQSVAYCGIYREGMASDQLDPAGIYFATNTGKIFASRDEGENWSLVADNLPPVYSISVSALD